MTMTEAPPVVCTLNPSEYKDRLAWIGSLTRDSLRGHERRDLVLDLRYAPEAAARVREMVRNEQACCSFLTFDLQEAPDEIRLTITAPESAREAADMLFEQFVADAPASSACACAVPSASDTTLRIAGKPPGVKAAGVTAMTLATGAVACGACCVLPFALPAAALVAAQGIARQCADPCQPVLKFTGGQHAGDGRRFGHGHCLLSPIGPAGFDASLADRLVPQVT